ncbi:hypothetical protein [Actinoplanes sp. NPDC020271]
MPYIMRTPDEIGGLRLIEPGLGPTTRCRAQGEFIDAYGAVARNG